MQYVIIVIITITVRDKGGIAMKHEYADVRIPIEMDNPSIQRDESKCIKCGQCRNGSQRVDQSSMGDCRRTCTGRKDRNSLKI